MNIRSYTDKQREAIHTDIMFCCALEKRRRFSVLVFMFVTVSSINLFPLHFGFKDTSTFLNSAKLEKGFFNITVFYRGFFNAHIKNTHKNS